MRPGVVLHVDSGGGSMLGISRDMLEYGSIELSLQPRLVSRIFAASIWAGDARAHLSPNSARACRKFS